eukprot:g4766.t1
MAGSPPPLSAKLGESLERTLVPLVRRFDEQLGTVSDSQDVLLRRLDSIAAAIEGFDEKIKAQPSYAEYADKIARLRARVGGITSSLSTIHKRLDNIEAMAQKKRQARQAAAAGGSGSQFSAKQGGGGSLAIDSESTAI